MKNFNETEEKSMKNFKETEEKLEATLTVTLDKHTYNSLKTLAKLEYRSRPAYVRILLMKHVEENLQKTKEKPSKNYMETLDEGWD